MKTILTLLIIFLAPRDSHAACGYIVEALNETMNRYRSFKNENQQRQGEMTDTERHCKERGAIVSEKAAKISTALSCLAQNDANALNEEIKSLGKDCESTFTGLKVLQTALRSRFDLVHTDLKEGLEYIEGQPLLRRNCGEELEVARTMTEAFLRLESNIVHGQIRSTEGEASYLRLKDTGAQLAARTADLGSSCGQTNDSTVAAISENGKNSKGQGSATPESIRKPSGPSDITGADRAIELGKESSKALDKK